MTAQAYEAERDAWIRRFNQLDAAVSRHQETTRAAGFSDTHDDALYAARGRIMRDAANSKPDPTTVQDLDMERARDHADAQGGGSE